MHIVLLILNIVLGLAFLAVGGMKLARPKAALVTSGLGWAENFPAPTVKLIGAAEVLGALGLVLPLVTGIAPVLAPVAAVCLLILMIGAISVHLRRHESPTPAVVLGALSVVSAILGFVALG